MGFVIMIYPLLTVRSDRFRVTYRDVAFLLVGVLWGLLNPMF